MKKKNDNMNDVHARLVNFILFALFSSNCFAILALHTTSLKRNYSVWAARRWILCKHELFLCKSCIFLDNSDFFYYSIINFIYGFHFLHDNVIPFFCTKVWCILAENDILNDLHTFVLERVPHSMKTVSGMSNHTTQNWLV